MRNLQTSQLVFPDPVENGDMVAVSGTDPLPVINKPAVAIMGTQVTSDLLFDFAKKGYLYTASDADVDDMVTGIATASWTTATPTFLLNVPAGTTAIPLFLNLNQAGTVAGGAITVIVAIDNRGRYLSGGAAEKAYNTLGNTAKSTLYSLPTISLDSVSYGTRVWGAVVGPDVSSAEGAVQGPFWRPEMPYILRGPASFIVHTLAGTTGPSWLWSIGWAEMPTDDFFGVV